MFLINHQLSICRTAKKLSLSSQRTLDLFGGNQKHKSPHCSPTAQLGDIIGSIPHKVLRNKPNSGINIYGTWAPQSGKWILIPWYSSLALPWQTIQMSVSQRVGKCLNVETIPSGKSIEHYTQHQSQSVTHVPKEMLVKYWCMWSTVMKSQVSLLDSFQANNQWVMTQLTWFLVCLKFSHQEVKTPSAPAKSSSCIPTPSQKSPLDCCHPLQSIDLIVFAVVALFSFSDWLVFTQGWSASKQELVGRSFAWCQKTTRSAQKPIPWLLFKSCSVSWRCRCTWYLAWVVLKKAILDTCKRGRASHLWSQAYACTSPLWFINQMN